MDYYFKEFFKTVNGNLKCAWYGFKDCLVGISKLWNVMYAQEPIRENVQRTPKFTQGCSAMKTIFHCLAFGICFWMSNCIFNALILSRIIFPLAEWFGQESVWFLYLTLRLLFFGSWLLPMFFLSKLLSFLWYQEIADIIFVSANIKKSIDYKISVSLADQLKSFLLQTVYCVQGYVVYLFPLHPFLQHGWYIYHLALLSSLYAFEYKWVHTGMLLHKRLLNIDKKWPYYLGFGFLLAVITMRFESFIDSMIAFTTLFPIYIISSAYILEEKIPVATYPVHSFMFADYASDMIITFFWKVLPAGFTFLTKR